MQTLFDYLAKGGPVMVPLGIFSVATLACTLERCWFWTRFLIRENKIVRDVLDASHYSLDEALKVANYARHLPIGRFLLAPLSLKRPSPETFRLALETSADREFIQMRRGDKLLETTVAVAPLLGLLGTVTGLINTFDSLNIGGGASSEAAGKAAAGIGEALLTTAAGMIVAIFALLILRVLVTLQSQQQDYFSQVGSELELIYRQVWYEPIYSKPDISAEKEGLETTLSLEPRQAR
jgi:biopolymer transport protein ExbB